MFIDIPGTGSIRMEAEPEEQEAANRAAKTAMEDLREVFGDRARVGVAKAAKPFSEALDEYC